MPIKRDPDFDQAVLDAIAECAADYAYVNTGTRSTRVALGGGSYTVAADYIEGGTHFRATIIFNPPADA